MNHVNKKTLFLFLLASCGLIEARVRSVDIKDPLVRAFTNELVQKKKPNLIAYIWGIIRSDDPFKEQHKRLHKLSRVIVWHPDSEKDGEIFDTSEREILQQVKLLYHWRAQGKPLKHAHDYIMKLRRKNAIKYKLKPMAKMIWKKAKKG